MSILKGAHKLLPRGTSPRKTNMQSPAIRNPHLGRSSSPVRGSIVESDPPSQNKNTARRLNFGSSDTNGARPQAGRANGSRTNGRRIPIDEEDDEEDDEEEAILRGRGESPDINGGGDDSLQMVGDYGDDLDPVPEEDEPDVETSIIEAVAEAAKPKSSSKPRGRPKKVREPEPEPEVESESEPEPFRDEPEEDDRAGSVSREPTPEPKPKSVQPNRKRGRPPKDQGRLQEDSDAGKKPVQRGRPARPSMDQLENQPESREEEESSVSKKKPGKRGRPAKAAIETIHDESESLAEEQEAEDAEPRAAKRPRHADKPAKLGRGRPKATKATPAVTDPTMEPVAGPSGAKSKEPKAEVPPKKRGRPPKSNVGEDSVLEKVQKGPPLPKSRGLLSIKRQDADAIITTKSGRHSYAPLHYWRNERVVYNDDNDVWDDGTSRGTKHDRFVLPSTKGVVRVEEEPAPYKRKRTQRTGKAAKGRTKREEDDDVEPPEPWELQEGRIEGETIVWDPDYEHNPPAPNEPVSFEVNEIAVSSNAIETRDVRDATFRFTKVLSMPFFGAGIVDLPPGAEKKPKNSRKNHMIFFVHYGKVLVTVNETQFRISAGGFWNVPRGKLTLKRWAGGKSQDLANDTEQEITTIFKTTTNSPPVSSSRKAPRLLSRSPRGDPSYRKRLERSRCIKCKG